MIGLIPEAACERESEWMRQLVGFDEETKILERRLTAPAGVAGDLTRTGIVTEVLWNEITTSARNSRAGTIRIAERTFCALMRVKAPRATAFRALDKRKHLVGGGMKLFKYCIQCSSGIGAGGGGNAWRRRHSCRPMRAGRFRTKCSSWW